MIGIVIVKWFFSKRIYFGKFQKTFISFGYNIIKNMLLRREKYFEIAQ